MDEQFEIQNIEEQESSGNSTEIIQETGTRLAASMAPMSSDPDPDPIVDNSKNI